MSKVRSVPGTSSDGMYSMSQAGTSSPLLGFYSITYIRGYRDEFKIDVNVLVNLIVAHEAILQDPILSRSSPDLTLSQDDDNITRVKEAIKFCCHM